MDGLRGYIEDCRVSIELVTSTGTCSVSVNGRKLQCSQCCSNVAMMNDEVVEPYF